MAATASGGQGFDRQSPDSLPKREAGILAATVAHTNARLCGQVAGHSNHPRLEMTFATPGGRKELKIKDAVADSGAHITIFPASLLEASGIQISAMRKSKVDLRAANNAKNEEQGVVDATISALSPSGERFKTTSRV